MFLLKNHFNKYRVSFDLIPACTKELDLCFAWR